MQHVRDHDEVLPEAVDHRNVARVVQRELEGDVRHVQLEQRHPAGRVSLFERAAGRERPVAFEYADVVEAQESAAEDPLAFTVFPVQPPAEHQHEGLEHRFEEGEVAAARIEPIDLVDLPDRPRRERRIHSVEVPLERGNRAVGVLRSRQRQQAHLLFGEGRIDFRHDDRLERKIPGRVPRVLPLVGHQHDVGVIEMKCPVAVASVQSLGWRRRLHRIALEPVVNVVVVELLRPEQSREGLPLHEPFVLGELRPLQAVVELVSLALPSGERGVETGKRLRLRGRAEPHLHRERSSGLHDGVDVRRRLAATLAIHAFPTRGHDGVMDAVFDVRCGARRAEQPLRVGVVLREEKVHRVRGSGTDVPPPLAEHRVVGTGFAVRDLLNPVARPAAPRPGIAVPEMGEDVNGGRLGAAVVDADAAENVIRPRFRIFHEHVEVALLAKRVFYRIEELVLGFVCAPPQVTGHQLGVRKCDLRVFVEHPRVRVGRRVVEIEEVLLDVLAVIALAVRQAEHPFLQNRIAFVPQRHAEAEVLFAVAEPREAVFVPAIRAAARVVVREVLPRVAVGAVVLPHGAPGAIAHVGAPALPVGLPGRCLDEAAAFCVSGHWPARHE